MIGSTFGVALALADGRVGPWTGWPVETLALVWFALLGFLLIGYAILDGFDLGVAMMHPFVARTDDERRRVLNSIGPVWDGNEVWLVTFGGALFAAFPEAYATILSAFYDAIFLVLLGLVLRAVSIEFRSKLASLGWRRTWDRIFFGSSVLVTFLFGVAVGNAMAGIALDARHDYTGGFSDLLTPFTLAAGVLAVALFALHGSIFLYLKTEEELQERVARCVRIAYAVFLVAFFGATVLALRTTPTSIVNLERAPGLWAVPVVGALAAGGIAVAMARGRAAMAFVMSCLTVACFVGLLGIALFPYMVRSSVEPGVNGLTVVNAASSPRTLEIMLLIAGVGMPLVMTYTGIVYWTFRGKVRLDGASY